MQKKEWLEWGWDAWCVLSILGIWPRYIEPQLLATTHLKISLENLPPSLVGTRIVQFSDLHWSRQLSHTLLKKMIGKINRFQPDLIFFTGDFLCRSQLEDGENLTQLLNALQAKYGCFAVLGNHDYAHYVTINQNGDYDVELPSSDATISKGFKRLFKPITLTKSITEKAKQIGLHNELVDLLKKTPFALLDNATELVSLKSSYINICGLGEYTLGRCDPSKAFKNYYPAYPGIVLTHNPDSFPLLENYPGDLLLAGHTHGGQVNLPFLWKAFTAMEQMQYKRGLMKVHHKWAYVNRGIAGVMKFRWFALPELTFMTLHGG